MSEDIRDLEKCLLQIFDENVWRIWISPDRCRQRLHASLQLFLTQLGENICCTSKHIFLFWELLLLFGIKHGKRRVASVTVNFWLITFTDDIAHFTFHMLWFKTYKMGWWEKAPSNVSLYGDSVTLFDAVVKKWSAPHPNTLKGKLQIADPGANLKRILMGPFSDMPLHPRPYPTSSPLVCVWQRSHHIKCHPKPIIHK